MHPGGLLFQSRHSSLRTSQLGNTLEGGTVVTEAVCLSVCLDTPVEYIVFAP